MAEIQGLVFDKDGTLLDFQTTWGRWAAGIVKDLAGGDDQRMSAMDAAIELDRAAERFLPSSLVIAGTAREVVDALLPHVSGHDAESLELFLNESVASAVIEPVTALRPLLMSLKDRGIMLGVATNDAESSARAHLEQLNAADLFDFVAGFDSGFGSKPEPGQLLAFIERTGLSASAVGMVGDSTHDLKAARAAKMVSIGVLTGPAHMDDLVPYADLVLPSIADLPVWLDNPD